MPGKGSAHTHLGRARRQAVRHDERLVRQHAVRVRRLEHVLLVAPPDRRRHRLAVHEHAPNVERELEPAAGVSPQIEHHVVDPLGAEVHQRLPQARHGLGVELGQADVAHRAAATHALRQVLHRVGGTFGGAFQGNGAKARAGGVVGVAVFQGDGR